VTAGPIFVSYKSDDVEFVRPVCERLLAEGYHPWLNEYHVPYDRVDDFQWLINYAIDTAAWGVLFASDRYAFSPYCNIEVERLLRRLPPERIVVLRIGDSPVFEREYREFAGRVAPAANEADVYARLADAGILGHPLAPRPLPDAPADRAWWLKDIGARFTLHPWRLDARSVMRNAGLEEWLDVTGEPREEYEAFTADIDGHRIGLTIDCRRLDAEWRESVERRATSDEGALRFLEDEQDDRQRLSEELRHFAREVEMARAALTLRRDAPDAGDALGARRFQPIGVHMFNTAETVNGRRNAYKHRLFSFRLAGRIYRVYKLVLPHPQLGQAVALRFVFEFDDDLTAFFVSLPFCDRAVRSLSWVTLRTKPALDLGRMQDVVRGVTGGPPEDK
jgi:hypothetical protein